MLKKKSARLFPNKRNILFLSLSLKRAIISEASRW